MFLVGCAYNFCWEHEGLRQAAADGAGRKWQERTPAMAAGLTDHRWTMRELLSNQVPLSPSTTLSIKQRAELLDEFPGRELPDRLPQQPIDHPTVHLR
jgi:hypothetical protein